VTTTTLSAKYTVISDISDKWSEREGIKEAQTSSTALAQLRTINMTSTLSPPWYTYWNKIKSTVGASPSIKVSDLEPTSPANYKVTIRSDNGGEANALAQILASSATFGNISLSVVVINPEQIIINPTSPEIVINLFNTAFRSNPLYVEAKSKPLLAGSTEIVFPIFAEKVVQFFNDDLTDYYSNANLVAADAFKAVLQSHVGVFPIYPSTTALPTTATKY